MKEPHFSQQFWLNRGMITDSQPEDQAWVDDLFQAEIIPPLIGESQLADGIHWQTGTASSLHAAGKPLSLYLPERYERDYDYPLVVWLHGDDNDEQELLDVMPQISDQNFMGIGFRGNSETKNNCTWGNDKIERTLFFSELHDTLRELRREFRIHPDRIYMAGMNDGATLAIQGLLHYPEWFAGAIGINGSFSKVESPLAQFRSFEEQRMLLMETTTEKQPPLATNETIQAGRLLHTAGIDARSEIYRTPTGVNTQILSRINQWIMESIATAW